MKNKIKSLLIANILLVSVVMLLVSVTSCKDEWNDHYDPSSPGLSYDGTIMSYLQSHNEFSDFAEIVEKAGFDVELASSQIYTLWAPVNGSFMKEEYLSMISRGGKNTVIKEFIKNHMTRYNVSYSSLGSDKRISLLSDKFVFMTQDCKFGTAQMTATNISCKNGVIHVIDKAQEYQENLYEAIERAHDAWLVLNPDQIGNDSLVSLYTFLQKYNDDSLDVNKSVERGVDESGNKVYVDSVMIRNNTILKGLDALLYTEDSLYKIIIPSVDAYQERYAVAREYLKYNPSENLVDPKMCDSLQNYYANMFAMTDLFYNVNLNQRGDSVVSTSYQRTNWENHVYYHPYDATSGIFKFNVRDSVSCSNGVAYLADEYPLSIYDQFAKKLTTSCSKAQNIDQTANASGVAIYTKNVDTSFPTGTLTVSGRTTDGFQIQYLDVKPTTSAVNPYIAFKVNNTLSTTYDMYLVYCPIWVKNYSSYADAKVFSDTLHAQVDRKEKGASLQNDPLRPYYFRVYVYERQNVGASMGQYPTSGTVIKNPVEGGNFFTTNVENYVDTLYLGQYTCENAYYNTTSEGILVQLQTNVTSKNTSVYSREMYLARIIFEPRFDAGNDPTSKSRKR